LIKKIASRLWDLLTSLPLAILCLGLLMALVLLCTLAQTRMGTFGAVEVYMRSFFVWWHPERLAFPLPVFPGGVLVGFVLGLNLLGAMARRLTWSWRKAGLWIVHAGLVLLFVGEFITGAFQTDRRMTIEEGQTVNYLEDPREVELAIIDQTDPKSDEVFSVPASLLAHRSFIDLPGSPISLRVKRYFPNATLSNRNPSDPPALATAGVGAMVNIAEKETTANENEMNIVSALVEITAGGQSRGVWLASLVLGAPQTFIHEGRAYALTMRQRRIYLPYSITLKDFKHDTYPGTDIPKNFSSLVRVSHPERSEERDALIYMNQPLRYDGKAFYQASFGKADTLTILQVVENPGWLLPYISCTLVTLGLLVHFFVTLYLSSQRRRASQEA